MINDYYKHAENLRTRLNETGNEEWAQELLDAERAASTSGEAISNITVVLRRLREHVRADLRREVDALLKEGDELWRGSTS